MGIGHASFGLRLHDTGTSHNCGLGVTLACYYKEKYVENCTPATHSPEDSTV